MANVETITRENLVSELKRLGIRVTAQRLAVAKVLLSSHDHPTAQDIYERVRSQLPHITMGTVYNTINTLARHGVISPLPFAESTRYDANVSSHANLVCVRCGSISDAVDDGIVSRLREHVTAPSGFQVLSQRVDLYGVCPSCRDDAERRN